MNSGVKTLQVKRATPAPAGSAEHRNFGRRRSYVHRKVRAEPDKRIKPSPGADVFYSAVSRRTPLPRLDAAHLAAGRIADPGHEPPSVSPEPAGLIRLRPLTNSRPLA